MDDASGLHGLNHQSKLHSAPYNPPSLRLPTHSLADKHSQPTRRRILMPTRPWSTVDRMLWGNTRGTLLCRRFARR